MILATEAKKQAVDFNSTIDKLLEDISGAIRLASYKGLYRIDILITDKDVKNRYRGRDNLHIINCNPSSVCGYELENKIKGYGYEVLSRPTINLDDKWTIALTICWK